MHGDCWAILEIGPTGDRRAIKRAYSKLLKANPPEGDAEAFQRLHGAYKMALGLAPFQGDSQDDGPSDSQDHHQSDGQDTDTNEDNAEDATPTDTPPDTRQDDPVIVALSELTGLWDTAEPDPTPTPPPREPTAAQREHIEEILTRVDALLRQPLRSSQPSAWQFLESHELLDPAYQHALGAGVLNRILTYEREQQRTRPRRPNLIGDQVMAFLNHIFLWSTRLPEYVDQDNYSALFSLEERLRIVGPSASPPPRGGKLVRERPPASVTLPANLKAIGRRFLSNLHATLGLLVWILFIVFVRFYEPVGPEDVPSGLEGVPVIERQLRNVHAGGENKLRESILLDRLAKAYMEAQQLIPALDYAQQALALASSLDNRQRQLDANWRVAHVYSNLSRYADAVPYYEKALVIAQQDGQRKVATHLLANVGYAYLHQSDTVMARPYLLQGLALARELGDEPQQVSILEALGIVATSEQQYDEALEHYADALSISTHFGDITLQVKHLHGLAHAYASKGDVEQALALYTQALADAQEGDEVPPVLGTLISIGLLHMKAGDPADARDALLRAYDAAREASYPLGVAEAQCSIGGSYAAEGKPRQGLSWVREGLALAKKLNHKPLIERCDEFRQRIELEL